MVVVRVVPAVCVGARFDPVRHFVRVPVVVTSRDLFYNRRGGRRGSRGSRGRRCGCRRLLTSGKRQTQRGQGKHAEKPIDVVLHAIMLSRCMAVSNLTGQPGEYSRSPNGCKLNFAGMRGV
jgi:hypothetical protein